MTLVVRGGRAIYTLKCHRLCNTVVDVEKYRSLAMLDSFSCTCSHVHINLAYQQWSGTLPPLIIETGIIRNEQTCGLPPFVNSNFLNN